MLKLLPIGAALATIVSAQVPEILPSAVKTAEQRANPTAMVATQPAHATNLPYTIAQTRYRTPQQSDDSGQVGTLVVLGAIGATAAVAVASSTKKKSFSLGNTTKQGSFNQASPRLQKRLMILLHNDQAAANRLINNIKLNHPHQSTNWATEKAIYDLERDRGGR
ncbi:hypothetical protein [Gloeocapsopsis dulcis]|uniref:Uncharacterized protein n=1 Tax=Gloeocapsopsis dulcis AAB1 = 1H9 TaxID=1433147 RepID=A0A6N8G162_9CHRO|nr:hypothetical protein [Gloeocapsopsis dulcis]MUL38325.1 hypothetical protein [Gloeocapsopsis dulcis AAB1 = 1H9]WNN91178.1 hypothetical protein P0S91_08930 [Gloeocapsopsis dulcis]